MLQKVNWADNQKDLPCPECGERRTAYFCFCDSDKAKFECTSCGWRMPNSGCDADKKGLIGTYIAMVNNQEGEAND